MSATITLEAYKENSIEVSTNIGKMPIAEYADIKASEYGFDDYPDLMENGYRIAMP